MTAFEGIECPACHIKLFDDDDIVVCPVCGAPYHRVCYDHFGQCVLASRHGTCAQWKRPSEPGHMPPPPAGQTSPPSGDRVGRTCPRCGKVSTSDTLFCPYCGLAAGQNQYPAPPGPGEMPPVGPFGMPWTPAPVFLRDPLGGVSPQENIDDIPVSEVASFVGQNTAHYIPRFAAIDKTGRRIHWNWAAFFLPGPWLLSRKCYLQGVAACLLQWACTMFFWPLLAAFTDLMQKYIPSDVTSSQQSYDILQRHMEEIPNNAYLLLGMGLLLLLLVGIVFGMFGDLIYERHALVRIRAIRGDDDIADKRAAIGAAGGVNVLLAVLALAAMYMGNKLFLMLFLSR